MPSDRVVVTGAPVFDKWFNREPRLDREAFCRKAQIRADVPFILFLGSSEDSSPPREELIFVRQWLRAVRQTPESDLGRAGVVIRPHPFNSAHWQNVSWANEDNVTVFPDHGVYPTARDARSDYFDTMFHAAAIVGINTSALIEAAIVGRTVHTILASEFTTRQTGTLHFNYLLPTNGGFLQVAADLPEHLEQLAETLKGPERRREATDSFVTSFLRPYGRETAATPLLVDAIERLAEQGPTRRIRMRRRFYPLSMLLWAMAWLAILPHAAKRHRAFQQTFFPGKKSLTTKWFRAMDFPTAKAAYRAARRRRKKRPPSAPRVGGGPGTPPDGIDAPS